MFLDSGFVGSAFLLYTASAVAVVLVLVLYCEPRYGQTNIMVYIGVCSIFGSLTVRKLNSCSFTVFLVTEILYQSAICLELI